MANLEEQLTSPESGYQRIDSANINFKLSGNAQIYNYSNNAGAYNSTSIYFPGGQGSTTFYVYTSKLYILGISHHNMTAVVNISIDDIDCGTLDLYTEDTKINASNQGQHVQYINTSLAKKVHKVVISTKDSAAIDCIDIDEDGHMVYCNDDGNLYYDIAPIMTSNTSPNGYEVSASTEFFQRDSYVYAGYLAFNGTTISHLDCWATSDGNLLGYLDLKFPKRQEVSAFTLTSRNLKEISYPKKFAIHGSNDGTKYTLLKTFDNQTFEVNNTKFYDLDRIYKYQYYRFEIIESGSDTSTLYGYTYTSIGELRYLVTTSNIPFLIKDKSANKLYGYDKENNSLIEVADASELESAPDICINNSDLNSVKELIDLTDDNISLISNKNFKLTVNGQKLTQEMIATLEPLNMKKYAVIHKITPNYDISGNGSIKIAFSFDDGITWKTWDSTNDWTDLSNVEVPLKLYENFSDADKTAWNNAQVEINTNGIDIRNLSNVVFPSEIKKICFALVFNKPTYADTATLTSFDILFDGLKTFVGLDRDKCSVKFSGDTITVSPANNADQLLITMITGTN